MCEVQTIEWMMIIHLPAGDVLTVEPCVAIDLAQLRRISIGALLCAFKNFIIDGTSQSSDAGIRASSSTAATILLWELGKSRWCYVIWRHYSIMYTQSLHAINMFNSCGMSGKLTLWTPLVIELNWIYGKQERNSPYVERIPDHRLYLSILL